MKVRQEYQHRAILILLATAAIGLWTSAIGNTAASYDTVILGGRVMDPESGLDAMRNVGIRQGKIAAISSGEMRGRRVIDAKGLVVVPGFIDLHEHGQESENYQFQARDGVTTSLELEIGTADVAKWYAERSGKALINYGVSSGHVPARMQVMKDPGSSLPKADAAHRPATSEELAQLVHRVESGLRQGGIALGMAINYTPAASHAEMLRMFQLAAQYNAPVHVHLRFLGTGEPNTGLAALEEVVALTAATGASAHVVHVTSMGLRETPLLLTMLAGARKRGLDITTECYPYAAASTSLESALFDLGWQERMGISYSDVQWVRTGERLTAESFTRFRKEGGEVVMFMIPEEVVRASVADPSVMIASDGMTFTGTKVHPRGQGTFARVLGRYVREEKALDLMTALRKMTLMPAQRLEKRVLAFKAKGRIQVNADADITVFDPDRIADKATFEFPLQYSEGIHFVLVNGIPVVDNGQVVSGVAPGHALRAAVLE